MSDREPDVPRAADAAVAFRELEQLVRHLAGELASFRRRALTAEAQLRALSATVTEALEPAAAEPADALRAEAPPAPATRPSAAAEPADLRVAQLERENAELRRRVEGATSRTRQLLERVRFLRQQHVIGG